MSYSPQTDANVSKEQTGSAEGASSRRRRRLPWLLPAVGVLLVSCAVGLRRLCRTPEFVAVCGSDKKRVDICRALPHLAAFRRERLFFRLIDDDLESVRIGAVTGMAGHDTTTEVDVRLEQILRDVSESAAVRTRAGEVLLGHRRAYAATMEYLREHKAETAFRRDCAVLVARCYAAGLPDAAPAERMELLQCSLDAADPVHEQLQQVVLDHIQEFTSQRKLFVDALEKDADFETRQYILSALSAIDGLMRGQHAEDWRQQTLTQVSDDQPHLFEAEWAQDIKPNYHIARFHGQYCLALGEGAGGVMHWLKGADATVDVGTARFNLFVPQAGDYRLWARVYLDDKCGNSFGVWMGDTRLQNFSDSQNVMGRWHWLPLASQAQQHVHLAAGSHRLRLEAWEDGVFIDKFVLLPTGRTPDKLSAEPPVVWDQSLNSSISFNLENQSQSRGTTQFVTVWVRRNNPDLTEGTVALRVPAPFEIVGESRNRIRFSAGNPLCRTSFRLHLPADAIAGEGMLAAVYTDVNGEIVEGRIILGGQYAWLYAGPFKPTDPAHAALAAKTSVTDEELKNVWKLYPQRGYDAYRRLNFESAFGQLRNVSLYLVSDILVEEEADYLALLTADDKAYVYIDGEPVISQPEGGPGEGRMVARPVHLAKGRRRVFVRHYQADFDDPTGPDSPRHSQNHCNLKFLLRQERHKPAETIKGLPMARPPSA